MMDVVRGRRDVAKGMRDVVIGVEGEQYTKLACCKDFRWIFPPELA